MKICRFDIRNINMKLSIDNQMMVAPVRFSAHIFSHSFKNEYVEN